MGRALSQLIDDIELEKIDINIFRGTPIDDARGHVYGGQVLAQAINAAGRTVARPLVLHSLHAYFLREGEPDLPVIFEVDRIRDGKTYTTRRVVAIQHGRPIFNVSLSYQVEEAGCIDHQPAMPVVDAPEPLLNDELFYEQMMGAQLQKGWPIEYRQLEPVNIHQPEARPGRTSVWLKSQGELADDLALHQELLAYATDHLLLQTALRPHGKSAWNPAVKMATLDHALWFHRPFRIDDWLLHEMETVVAYGGRAFCRGQVFNRAGELVASTAQEGVIREDNEA
ncbi:MAG TPA: acyl-CoA thioesterase II [Pseudomonadales bacterium]